MGYFRYDVVSQKPQDEVTASLKFKVFSTISPIVVLILKVVVAVDLNGDFQSLARKIDFSWPLSEQEAWVDIQSKQAAPVLQAGLARLPSRNQD